MSPSLRPLLSSTRIKHAYLTSFWHGYSYVSGDPDDRPQLGPMEASRIEDHFLVLKFADKWGFKSLRSDSINRLKREIHDPIAKLALYNDYEVKPDDLYFAPAVEELVQREEEVKVAEASRIGLETLMRLCTIRALYSCSPDLKHPNHLREKICQVWSIPQELQC